ncbi:Redox-regulatory protein [Oopsacas minuta]|uniref:Peroxiredoxin-like 2A n=1 Tax=Oopsacas minuta TaxID=111878 RepID=A0AAV7KDA6_9METZ|nr:Redox-regulatory protein [Oopsacas minuta]
MGVGLVGVCHQRHGAAGFAPFLGGKIYVNNTREIFGPVMRWIGITTIFSPSVLYSFFSSWRHGHAAEANFEGEGRLLGGVYVMGQGDQGVVYHFEEPQPGVYAPIDEVLRAAESVQIK